MEEFKIIPQGYPLLVIQIVKGDDTAFIGRVVAWRQVGEEMDEMMPMVTWEREDGSSGILAGDCDGPDPDLDVRTWIVEPHDLAVARAKAERQLKHWKAAL